MFQSMRQVYRFIIFTHLLSIEIKNSQDQVETTYEIKEQDFNISSLRAIMKPFLAYAKKGSANSVNFISFYN